MSEFSFDEQLRKSDGHCETACVNDILLSNVVGSVAVERAGERDDRSGTDWWVRCGNGERRSIDAKVRYVDYSLKGKDDLALETWSVVGKKIGWTLDHNKRTDYVLWLWESTGRWCMVPFVMLCTVFHDMKDEWCQEYQVARQVTRSQRGDWESECVFVPRREVWKAIYRRFA